MVYTVFEVNGNRFFEMLKFDFVLKNDAVSMFKYMTLVTTIYFWFIVIAYFVAGDSEFFETAFKFGGIFLGLLAVSVADVLVLKGKEAYRNRCR